MRPVRSPTYTLTVIAGAGGTATGSAGGLAGNATPAISASPNAGYAFVDWPGDLPADPNAPLSSIGG
ncbi:MAG: InlB B-repeat-containing protein [Opitutaceae bacterium]